MYHPYKNYEVVETVTDSRGITYKRLNTGTCYHMDTPMEVVNIIEDHLQMRSRPRLKIHFGDAKNGKDWNEENMVEGMIGRSTGTIKIPLLVHNNRSYGGPALLDDCIVKIVTARGGHVLYQHPFYQPPVIEVKASHEPGYTHSVYIDGQLYSNHRSEREAQNLARKMAK